MKKFEIIIQICAIGFVIGSLAFLAHFFTNPRLIGDACSIYQMPAADGCHACSIYRMRAHGCGDGR